MSWNYPRYHSRLNTNIRYHTVHTEPELYWYGGNAKRLFGLFKAPRDGTYRFYVSAAYGSKLWLNAKTPKDTNPNNLELIAYSGYAKWTNQHHHRLRRYQYAGEWKTS